MYSYLSTSGSQSLTNLQVTYGCTVSIWSENFNKYLCAEKEKLTCDRQEVKNNEVFYLEKAPPLIVDQNTNTIEKRNEAIGTPIQYGDLVYLRTSANLYVTGESSGNASADRRYAQTWEAFKITSATGIHGVVQQGHIINFFNAYHKRYLVVERDLRVNCNRREAREFEKFSIRILQRPSQHIYPQITAPQPTQTRPVQTQQYGYNPYLPPQQNTRPTQPLTMPPPQQYTQYNYQPQPQPQQQQYYPYNQPPQYPYTIQAQQPYTQTQQPHQPPQQSFGNPYSLPPSQYPQQVTVPQQIFSSSPPVSQYPPQRTYSQPQQPQQVPQHVYSTSPNQYAQMKPVNKREKIETLLGYLNFELIQTSKLERVRKFCEEPGEKYSLTIDDTNQILDHLTLGSHKLDALKTIVPNEKCSIPLAKANSIISKFNQDSEKVKVLQVLVSQKKEQMSQVTCDEAITLLKLYAMESMRFDALKLFAEHVSDKKENSRLLVEQFNFNNFKEKAKQLLST